MSQYNISQLKDLQNRPVLAATPIFYRDEGAFRNDVELRLAALADSLVARSNNQASSTTPATFQGQWWADTSNASRVVWKGAPNAVGFNDEFATRLEAWRKNYKTSGGSNFPLGGRFDGNTADTAATLTQTLPANTLDTDGQVFEYVSEKLHSGAGSSQLTFDATPYAALSAQPTEAIGQLWVFRRSATTALVVGQYSTANDASGDQFHVGVAADNSLSFTANLAVAETVNASGVNHASALAKS